jgi:NAD(P)H-hydrate epimerase
MSRSTKPQLAALKRRKDAHKGDFGRVLVLGGSRDMPGAPALAASAALRAGAGLVRIACPLAIQQTVVGLCPCATSAALPQTQSGLISGRAAGAVRKLARESDVAAVGPGMGTSAGGAALVAAVLSTPDLPVVVDADGLNNLAMSKGWWRSCRADVVLTPHPGEMRRLIEGAGLTLDPAKRRDCCVRFARHVGQVVVLKGAGSVVSDAHRVYVNKTGNPGMATGGSGDVLTGVIAALMGQGLAPFDAAAMGVYLHGLAGDLAARNLGQVSLIATDLIEFLPEAVIRLAHKSSR